MGVEKSIADDLTHDLLGSAVVPFGSPFEAFESLSAVVHKLAQDLVVTLSSIPKFLGSLGGAETFAFALKEHSQLKSDLIVFPNGKRSFWAK
jgi:hypothetical protein